MPDDVMAWTIREVGDLRRHKSHVTSLYYHPDKSCKSWKAGRCRFGFKEVPIGPDQYRLLVYADINGTYGANDL